MVLWRFSSNCCLHSLLIRKTFRIPFKNHARAASKYFLKTHCFFTSVFKCLGLDFGSWTPRWSQVRHFAFPKTHHGRPWGPSEIRRFLQTSFWRIPSSILDAMSFVFGGFGKDYCEISKRDAQGGWAAKNLQNLGFNGSLNAQQTFNLNGMNGRNRIKC